MSVVEESMVVRGEAATWMMRRGADLLTDLEERILLCHINNMHVR